MRIAQENDLPTIVSIYNSTVSTRLSTADTTEVTVESRMEWFRRHNPKKYPLLVHEQNDTVIAWVSFQPFYGRPAYDHTSEISIYISPESRGKGLGKALLAEALEMTKTLDMKTVMAFVFSHNVPSIRLFMKSGFEKWGKFPNIAEIDGKEFSVSVLGKRVSP